MMENRRKTEKHFSELNRMLGEMPEAGTLCSADTPQEIALCKELARDGYVKIEHSGEKVTYFKLTADGMVFRRNGGYKLPPKDRTTGTYIAAIIAAVGTLITAVGTLILLFR